MTMEAVAEFRTPEQVAPTLGMKPTTLRRLCRETGINTRLERNRITLSPEDVQRMIEHLKQAKEAEPAAEADPFAA
ncbi:hypothetical protein [Arthrobacter rhombi]|uniref:hypothetical protein n=1 Tax=Arthrobacter rhombi TaxID=71253 RepID=UPI003FD2B1C7